MAGLGPVAGLGPLAREARSSARADDWPWSSYRAMIGAEPAPAWLAVDGLLRGFGRTRSEARMNPYLKPGRSNVGV